MNKSWRVSQCAAVTAIALLLGSSAEAGFVRGGFDPTTDGIVPGYSGSVLFDVDDSCFQSGFTGYEKVSADCGPVDVVSGEVFLFGLTPSDGDPINHPQLDSFTLGPGDLTVTGLRFVNGAVQGIDTEIGGLFSGSSTYNGYQFFLQFVTGCLDPDSNGGDPYLNCGDAPVVPLFVELLAATPIEQNLQQALLFVDTDTCGGGVSFRTVAHGTWESPIRPRARARNARADARRVGRRLAGAAAQDESSGLNPV